MAAPVHRQGRVAGSLALGSHEPGRRFSAEEQDVLLAFAEHASLALTDASTVEELREAQHAKDLFLAMVSHELKTPLTVIMGTLRTLERRDALPAEVRTRLLAAAFQRGRDLERLIDRLLQGSRAELAAERHSVALPELVAGAVDGFQATGRLVQGPVADVEVPVDAEAVRRVVGILLENAVAHAPEGTEIAVEAAVAGGSCASPCATRAACPRSWTATPCSSRSSAGPVRAPPASGWACQSPGGWRPPRAGASMSPPDGSRSRSRCASRWKATAAALDLAARGRHRRRMDDGRRPPRRALFSDGRRGMRASWHADRGLAVLSLWQEDLCVGTFTLPAEDARRLAAFLNGHAGAGHGPSSDGHPGDGHGQARRAG